MATKESKTHKQLLKETIKVKLKDLYLDPNNPRLPQFHSPGYDSVKDLFDSETQLKLEEMLSLTNLKELGDSIVGTQWLAIDSIIVWEHPDAEGKYVVVEGNRRTATLRDIRKRLAVEEEKLKKQKARKNLNKDQQKVLEEQEKIVDALRVVVASTEEVEVKPLNCPDPLKVQELLMRVLAVRHITGAKEWGAYAQDVFMYVYYDQLFEEKHGDVELFLDQELINVVAKDCSVGAAKCKQTLRGIRAFEHFKANWEHALPKGEEFTGSPGDYYAFQKIMTSPFVREQFGIKSDADLTLSQEGELALFTWMFKNPHNNLTAENNTNLWPAARATDEWNKLNAYDIANGTHFAASYDVSDPEAATERMDVLINKMGLHQNQVEPIDLIDDLIRQLKAIPNESFEKQGANLLDSLEDLEKWLKNTKKRVLGK